MQNITVVKDIFVLQIEEANVVLVCHWLEKLGPITTDHRKLTMEFNGPSGRVQLQGNPHLVENAMSESSLKRLMVKGGISYYYLLNCENRELEESENNFEGIKKILGEFDYLFAEPTGRPLEWRRNHRIILNPHTPPINVHPY